MPRKTKKRVHVGRPVPRRLKSGAPPALDIEASPKRQVYLTDVALRDGHQSLLATRMRTEDLLPAATALDEVGFWSLEVWGGATFDACLRFLKEDPWERLRAFRQAMPKTPTTNVVAWTKRSGVSALCR